MLHTLPAAPPEYGVFSFVMSVITRFAPSPTGSLHFGSLIAAVGSYLDAKHHQGKWIVRIEDLDTPRTVKGAADDILRTLEALGLYWDEPILSQSQRTAAYEDALNNLKIIGAAYPCACSRKEISDSALHGMDGQIYLGTCRNGIPLGREGRAWRINTKRQTITFNDLLQGRITQHIESEFGDFIIKRADGLFAYQLAVVIDDSFQGISHVVRGSDLLTSTPRQIHLQQLLGLITPTYMHLPIAINAQGEKLSKQTLATPINLNDIPGTLWRALKFMNQPIPDKFALFKPNEILDWAVTHWNKDTLKGILQIEAK